MKSVIGQLSLPLFEPDSSERLPQKTPPETSQVTPPPVTAPRTASASAGPALLTTDEAAGLLRVHRRTVQRLVERGELAAVRLGSAVRFDPVDLTALTHRLKRYEHSTTVTPADEIRHGRGARVSFADRLRSHQHEHRAAEA